MSAVTVLGVGNVILGDDAFGPQVVRRLQAFYQFGPTVSLIDVLTADLATHSQIAGSQALIVVKTMQVEGQPGELRIFRRGEYLDPSTVTTQPGLKETLRSLDQRGTAPSEMLVVGVIPREVGERIGMSPMVETAVPLATEHVLRELIRIGHPPTRSWTLSTPDLSWEPLEEVN